jgi:hypothetical protein
MVNVIIRDGTGISGAAGAKGISLIIQNTRLDICEFLSDHSN